MRQVGEKVTAIIESSNTQQMAGGRSISTNVVYSPCEYYPVEADLKEIKPSSSCDLEYKPKLLRNYQNERMRITLSYTNSLNSYIRNSKNEITLKSDKKIYNGYLRASLDLP
jgi:hypothetical protein